MSRPLMTAVAAQQAVLDQIRHKQSVQDQQIAMIARLAGISLEIAKIADIANPAQPVPDPGEQGATETTEQTLEPKTHDDARSPGQTPGSVEGVPAHTTDVAINPGGTIPTQPFNNLIDVTTPTSGTNTGEVPLDQMRIETDVRAMDPMQPEVAFPWTISPNQSNDSPPHDGEMSHGKSAASRFPASLRLARLRITSGLASGDDITLAASIDASSLPDAVIEHEIRTLEGVSKAASRAPRGDGVPRRTASNVRSAPSLASSPAPLSEGVQDDFLLFLD